MADRTTFSSKEVEDKYKKNMAKAQPKDIKLNVDTSSPTIKNPLMDRAKSSAQSAEDAMDKLKAGRNPVKLLVDEAGNVSHIDPSTGKVTEVKGNFSKLVDIFDELAGKAKGVANDAVDSAKGLLRNPDKVVNTGNAAIGRGAPAAIEEGVGLGAKAAMAGRVATPVGAFLAMMGSDDLNAGETDPDNGSPSDMDQERSKGLDLINQSNAAMDPGINPGKQAPQETIAPSGRPDTEVGQSLPQASTMVDNSTGRGVQTKGGFFPVYEKGSGEAQDFRTAFANAVSGGLATFNWQGREYTTQIKGTSNTSDAGTEVQG